MAYVPNATDSAQPVESQAVESAALEFRTLKSRVNGLQAAVEAEDLKNLRVPEATIGDIPTAAARAGKVLGFDAAGQPVGVEVSGVSDPSLRADLAASGGVGLVNGAAASGENTDITSIAGNAATATTAAAAPWSGITDKPTTVSGYGISDMGSQSVSYASTAGTDTQHLGVGQTWQSMLGIGGRASGVTIYNTTGKPILVSVWTAASTLSSISMVVNGVAIGDSNYNGLAIGNGKVTMSAIIPDSGSYTVTATTISGWAELR